MTLSPSERREVVKMVADRIIAEIREEAGGDLASIVVIPLAAAGHLVGLTRQQLPKLIPVTVIGPSTHGVTLRNLQLHIAKNTRKPKPAAQ